MRRITLPSRRGFTLIELLVVISIIAILASLLFTVLGRSRMESNKTTSMNNLRNWGGGYMRSLADFNGELPSDGQGSGKINLDDTGAWFNRIPPYINEKPLSDPEYAKTPPRPGQRSIWINPALPKKVGDPFVQPPSKFLFCYSMNYFLSKSSDPHQAIARIERPAATVLMAEKGDDFANVNPKYIKAYFGPGDAEKDKRNAAHFLFCDGHVELIERAKFDPTFAPDTQDNPSPVNNTRLNQHFTFVPFEGATSN